MSSSSESDFENNSFETDESDEFPSENQLSDSLWERFPNILPYQLEPEKEENIEDTLDNVGSVPVNNVRTKGLTHMSWIVLREITGVFGTNVVKKREKLIACVAVM